MPLAPPSVFPNSRFHTGAVPGVALGMTMDVASIQYLQNGYYGKRAGDPDFWWTDTMWDKLK